jgi:RHS repeat-associated protein
MTWKSDPFGSYLLGNGSGVDATEHHFTGKERDAESGNDYFGARYYGSGIGRFLSPDPMGIASGSLTNPQSLNLYAYALNNPLINIDPDGRECVWDDGSYDSADDPDTGDPDKCGGQGGTWIGHDVFANSIYNRGDWSGDANDALSGLVGQIQSCSDAVGGGQGASLLIADAFASGFSNDMTAYTLASALHESGPDSIGQLMTESDYGAGQSYFNKYNGILGNTSNADAFNYRGRGYIQITGKQNYQKWSNELGVNFVANPNLAAVPDNAAQIAVEGLDRGGFTGVSLYNYVNPGGTDFVNARRTVNGIDDAKGIASSANSFASALSGCR